jgi:hypothetical protein
VLDFRLKKPQSAVNWRYQEIIVTQDYLDNHAADPNLIELDYAYVMGKKVLDVYLNGQRLTEGGGYEEVDPLHIRLDIREYDDQGNLVPSTLKVGDEIVIKEWFNADSVLYGSTGINTRLTNLEIEVHEARLGFPKLKDKILDMDRELANLLGEGNYEIDYQYDPTNNEDVVKEIVTGDYELTREFVYNQFGKPVQEIILHGNKKTTRIYTYDPITGRILKVASQTVTI